MTNELILEALKNVQEPDLGKDLVTLQMVRDINISGDNVSFTIVLTTPACPLKELIKRDCETAIHNFVSRDAKITVKFIANTTTSR